MGDVLIPQLTDFTLTGEYSCSRMFGFCSSPSWTTLNSEDYIRRMMSDKPEFIKNNDYIDNLYKKIKEDKNPRETVRILHMSDLHVDLMYEAGTNKHCNEPLCCRAVNGPAPTPADAAGLFGDYECDLPPQTLESMFHFVRDMDDKPDLVIWTGDNVAHDVWNQTTHKNTESTILITEYIKSHWPEMPVFVSPGNHEFYPVNVEGFDENDQPVLNLLAQHWKDWIDEESLELFKKYGYFHLKLRDLSEEFSNVRVITLNTQASNDLNWNLLSSLNDPGNQLKWLEEQLREIESTDEIAIIIGHIPPDVALTEWSIRYKALVERFQHVIRFQGFGHVHQEEFNVVRGVFDFKPISSYHQAGSLTTFTGKNPSFRMMDFDKETMLPLRMHTYFLNITKANSEGAIQWEHAYEFTEAYGLDDLSPSALSSLPDKFFENPQLAVKYLKARAGQGGSDSQGVNSCDEGCLFELKCNINSVNKMLYKDCMGQPRYDVIRDLMNGEFNEYVFDPWVEGPTPK
eukprot:CAMPEP_0168351852 /NCGR_PEP_ID=MMETSP0213-20121227/22163_1 /TAXON_ID=151035 /ORGANISM="Euplotes harpa, Strain FSP1.4" /LENGTH=514 /DNA_ID=CAMNT_0008362873 /DNA_START=374 /DNA_END=1918 /DNA_ORIENTATION=+